LLLHVLTDVLLLLTGVETVLGFVALLTGAELTGELTVVYLLGVGLLALLYLLGELQGLLADGVGLLLYLLGELMGLLMLTLLYLLTELGRPETEEPETEPEPEGLPVVQVVGLVGVMVVTEVRV